MHCVKSLQLQLLQRIPTKATMPHLYLFSSLTKTPNTLLLNYLIQTLNFSKTEAQSISNSTRFYNVKSLENPHCVLHYLQSLGFSETEIRSSVRSSPQILFSDVDKTLKPKIEFFQEMGLVGPDLCKFISSDSKLVTCSLEKSLIPSTQILKKILLNDSNNKKLISVIRRLSWLITTNPERKLLSNIALFESCGIVGSQLSMLLKTTPRIFVMEESYLRDLVSREFWFTKHEALQIFRRQPTVFSKSEEQLKLRLDFFLNKIELKKEPLIGAPCLAYSLEKRDFLEKFVAKFRDDAEELLVAYRGHLLDSSSSQEEKSCG
ncbi:hypothetical protein JRO89_XS08G0029600 [Xanthoceras sorbifolium]|uniref:Uncharacterized protein n=1 Tax=Xanthoceras sorbifolium TaxID=99658 RepID=A0ABQ8HNH5_9ROSI|nr:hypothetical protein JRO89_XS08G0029600 [Xanthoceras sorbifolium]